MNRTGAILMTKYKEIIVERDVPGQMRDGITLYANIYRPKAEGNFPVMLTRLPYDKNLPNFSHRYIDPIRAALNGYIVIIQDVRGRFSSEGDFKPYLQEYEDGYDSVEWAAKLPYSNGKVGMFGMSYYAFTQLYAAMERPPSLVTIMPAMSGNLTRNGLFNRDGIHELAATETWILDSVAPDYLERKQKDNVEETKKEIIQDLDNIDEWHKYKPVKEWPPIQKHPTLIPFFEEYFIDDFGEKLRDLTEEKKKKNGPIDYPAYHIAGWYDSHLAPTLWNYESMQSEKQNQRLLIGPWAHGVFDSDIGERAFGLESSGDSIGGKDDFTALHIRWFNYWLKDDQSAVNKEDPVKIFVMGENKWRTEKEWPIKRTKYTPFYLTSNGNANADKEAGILTEVKPNKKGQDAYIHDPMHPVPSLGGGTLFFKGRNAGPRDQREVEQRDDVAVYTSEPLIEPLEVTGWIKVKLWASSDAVDTDFTAKLVDVLPDGTAYNLADGIVRASEQHAHEIPLNGKVIEYEIDLWATSNVFLQGHSIRLEIASSNFPRFEVNPGTGDTILETEENLKAKQMIYHGPDYPSRIILPVIPRE